MASEPCSLSCQVEEGRPLLPPAPVEEVVELGEDMVDIKKVFLVGNVDGWYDGRVTCTDRSPRC